MIGLLLLRLSTSASFPSPPVLFWTAEKREGETGTTPQREKREGGREEHSMGRLGGRGGLNSGRKRGRGGKRTTATVVGASCRERAEQLGEGGGEESGIESGERKEGDTCWYGHERREGGKRNKRDSRKVRRRRRRSTTYSLSPSQKLRRVHSTDAMAQKTEERRNRGRERR